MGTSAISGATSTPQINYLDNPVAAAKQLAASQTISSDQDVRLALGLALSFSHYSPPLQAAWTELGMSLASGDSISFFGVGSGDLSAAKTALDSYMQLLPSSDLYMSTLTTPSQAFLNNLNTMKTAIASGDLAGAQTAFGHALTNQPTDIGSAMGQANFSGDADNQARLTMESAANFAGYLTSIGYTQENANIEANAMVLGSVTETPAGMTVQNRALEAQAERQTTAVASLESSIAPVSNQLVATAASEIYKIYEALFAADPYAVRDSNMNANAERAVVLNQLFSSLNGQNSAGVPATTTVSVSA